MANDELRKHLKSNNVYLWEVANVLSIHETTLIKRLRCELDDDNKQKIYLAIEEILLNR